MNLTFLFTAALLCAAAPARAEDKKGGLTQQQAEDIARLVTRPAIEVVKPAADRAGAALYEALINTNAASWALWNLANGLAAQQNAGKQPEPDLKLTETYIRLRMRCNTADLCMRAGGACKAYPGDADFAKAAGYAHKDITAYMNVIKKQSPLSRQHRRRLENALDTARKRATFQLRVTRAADVDTTPVTPAEDEYRQIALAKRLGNTFTQPPWP